MQTIRWGILGPGRIVAHVRRPGCAEAAGAELVAVGSRDLARAAAFAADFGAARAHGSYADLAADPDVDAVYIGTPHAFHASTPCSAWRRASTCSARSRWRSNAAQVERMIAAARAADLVADGGHVDPLPAGGDPRARAGGLDGTIGEVRSVVADFGFRAAVRSRKPALRARAGRRLAARPRRLPPQPGLLLCGEPVEIQTMATLGATGVDEEAAILLRHAGGQLSTCSLLPAGGHAARGAHPGHRGKHHPVPARGGPAPGS